MRKVINGIKTYHQDIANSPISEMRVSFFAGARFDEIPGQSHFVEHAIFCGTKNSSEEEITKKIQLNGSYANAMTSRETVTYYIQSLSDKIEESALILCDMLNEHDLPYKKLRREKGAIKREIALRNTVDAVLDDAINGHFFGEEFGEPVSGTEDGINKMSKRHLKKFIKKHYNKDSCSVSLVGDISNDLAERIVSSLNIAEGSKPVTSEFLPVVVDNPDGIFKIGEIDPKEEIILTMRWPSYPMGHKDNPTIDLLMQVMSDGYSSRLDEQLRVKHGMSYSTSMDSIKYSDRGCIDLQGNFHGDEIEKAVDLIQKEIKRIKESKISEFELMSNRNQLLFAAKQSTMYPMLQAHDEALSFMFNLNRPNDYVRKMMDVSREDIIRVANELLTVNPIVYAHN